MPITFPIRPFAEEFAEARERVLEYFDFGYEVHNRVTAALRQLKQLEAEGRRYPSKGKKAGRVIAEIADEFEVSMSYCQAAKTCGRVFPRRELGALLIEFQEHRLIPTREHFISLSSVPLPSQRHFIESMLENRWTAKHIKEERRRQFGVRSNGYQRPRPPSTREEALHQFDYAFNRLAVVFDRLRQVQEGVSCPPDEVDFRVPRSLMPRVKACVDALGEVRARLECRL